MSTAAPLYREDAQRGPACEGNLLAAAHAMKQGLAEHRAYCEANATLHSSIVDAFEKAGFFRILQPAVFGGLELPASLLFRIEIALAEADMSAAWVLANMGVAAFHTSLFPPEAQDEVWGERPDTKLSFASMPGGRLRLNADGTFGLSGKWRFSSGVNHADWVVLGAIDPTGGEPVAGACLVPCKDLQIVQDWDVAGLRGTGSHAAVVENATLPPHRFLPHLSRFDGSAPGRIANNGPLYRLPLPQLLFRSISSASIGGLRGMLTDFLRANAERTSMMAQRISQDPHIQALCGCIEADLRAFEAMLDSDFALMEATGCPGDADDLARRRAMRLNVTRIPDKCFLYAVDLYRAAGAAALYRDSIILHIFNDLLAARQHAANQYELHARNDGAVLFGEEREDILL